MIGKTLGPYQILDKLGEGGMGEVYRAHDSRLGRDVALKILPEAMATDPAGLARFEREARAVAALNHPHIVTIYTTEEAEGTRFMTMEVVEGRTLDQLIPSGGLPMVQFFDIAMALADALQAAHQKHITHRDLKPSNVMVADDGRVKVLDFGLASAAEQPRADAGADVTKPALTRAGTILGTIPYMSPEQLEGKPIDHRSDLFSLGVVLYEMASGERPFRGDSSPALMSSILRDHPMALAVRRPDVPDGVARLVARCLQKPLRDRMQSAQDVLVEIKALRRAWESGTLTTPQKAEPRQEPGRTTSIAVLPFRDMSADKDHDWFCDGIAEEILNALAPLKGLRVAARTSAFSFKGKGDDLRAIGEKLNVSTVLEGSVRRAGDRVRITVQLSSVADGFQLWSERYDRELKDIFDVQDEIAKAIAAKLAVTLGSGEHERLVAQGTANIEAYQLYLRGRALLLRRGASVPSALDLLRQAVALDPDYSLAWAGIAEAYTVLAYFGFVRGSESKAPAIAAATRAIELDPLSAAAHTALAGAILLHDNDRALARREFERALELNPDYLFGRQWYALFFLQWACGEFDRGIEEARRALASDPLSAYGTMVLSACLSTAGQLEEAIRYGRLAVERDPESFVARWALGHALGTAGRLDEAREVLEGAAAMSGRHPLAISSLAFAFGQAGQREAAEPLFRELVERSTRAYLPLATLAIAAEAAGHREEAIALARRAWDEREPSFVLFARHFPAFRSLHSDPRFAAILEEMNA